MRRIRLPSPALQYSFQDVAGPVVLESEKPAGKVEATSPATPLSFSPSESDEKRNRFKSKLSVKKVLNLQISENSLSLRFGFASFDLIYLQFMFNSSIFPFICAVVKFNFL